MSRERLAVGLSMGLLAGLLACDDSDPATTETDPPIVEDCQPVCSSTQTCDQSQTPPACVELCNPPGGCRAPTAWWDGTAVSFEQCHPDQADSPTTGCEPISCGGEQCEPGQTCLDLASLQFDPGMPCSCIPDTTTPLFGEAVQSDTCKPYGRICDWDYNGTVSLPAKCRLPGRSRVPLQWEPCLPAVGCEEGYACHPEFQICMQSCETTADCLDPLTECVDTGEAKYCNYQRCTDGALGSDLDRMFAPCDAQGTGDGTCIPVWNTYKFTPEQSGVIGLCQQAGHAGTGQGRTSCDPDARRPALEAMCPVGQFCDPWGPDPDRPGSRRGICRPMCNAGHGDWMSGPNPELGCADPTDACVQAFYFGFPINRMTQADVDPYWFPTTPGICVPSCDPTGDGSCPEDPFGDQQICQLRFQFHGGQGTCGPSSPEPKALREACDYAPFDPRSPCTDGTVCAQSEMFEEKILRGGFCTNYCSTQRCNLIGGNCTECNPARCAAPPETCAPRCENKECGADGCGGTCGSCAEGELCNYLGKCVIPVPCPWACADGEVCFAGACCRPNCANRECGTDGCGGFCGPVPTGSCDEGQVCLENLPTELHTCYPLYGTVGFCGP